MQVVADIIELGVREHPELGIGSQSEGVEVWAVLVSCPWQCGGGSNALALRLHCLAWQPRCCRRQRAPFPA